MRLDLERLAIFYNNDVLRWKNDFGGDNNDFNYDGDDFFDDNFYDGDDIFDDNYYDYGNESGNGNDDDYGLGYAL